MGKPQLLECPPYVGKQLTRRGKPHRNKGMECILLKDPANGKTLAVVCYKHVNMIEGLMADMKAWETGQDVETIEIVRVSVKELVGHAEKEYVCCVKSKA